MWYETIKSIFSEHIKYMNIFVIDNKKKEVYINKKCCIMSIKTISISWYFTLNDFQKTLKIPMIYQL